MSIEDDIRAGAQGMMHCHEEQFPPWTILANAVEEFQLRVLYKGRVVYQVDFDSDEEMRLEIDKITKMISEYGRFPKGMGHE